MRQWTTRLQLGPAPPCSRNTNRGVHKRNHLNNSISRRVSGAWRRVNVWARYEQKARVTSLGDLKRLYIIYRTGRPYLRAARP